MDRPDLLVPLEELNALVGMAELDRLEQRYLRPNQLHQKYHDAAPGATR